MHPVHQRVHNHPMLKEMGELSPPNAKHLDSPGMMHFSDAQARLGSGARFAALKAKIAQRGGVRDPGAVAAAIGRAKYGKKKFQALAAKGRKGK